jgi:hypothetical protein
MDFPSYPVDIVLPSFNHADTAHDQLLLRIDGRTKRSGFANSFPRKAFFTA